MKYRLITEEDLLKVSEGTDLHLNITEKTQRAFRGLHKLTLLKQLRDVAKLLKKMKEMYRNYPSPEGFEEWHKEVREITKEVKKRFSRR